MNNDKTEKIIDERVPGTGFIKPPLQRTSLSKGRSISFLWESHLKFTFLEVSLLKVFRREEKLLTIFWYTFQEI